jgi:uncharacterized membrane protein YkvA (DUF1232 family)
MPAWLWWAAAGALAAYVLLVLAFAAGGRREAARAVAGFVPDCVVLLGRLLRDDRLPWWKRALIGAVVPYVALPFDLVPDFIPVAGQLDDAVVVALVLRLVVRASPELVREHWPGPASSLELLLRVAGGRARQPSARRGVR